MTSLYNDLDFINVVDGIDVDRLSMPSSPTHPSRHRNGSINTVGSGGGDGGGGGGGGDNGMGSLADELAALDYDDDDDEEDGYGEGEEGEEGEEDEGFEEGGDVEGGEGREEGEELEVVDDEEEGEGQERVGELPIGVSEGDVDNVSGPASRRRSSTTTSNRTINSHARSRSKASTLSSPKSKRRSGTARPYNPDGDSEDDSLGDLKDGITYELQGRIDQIERLALEGKRMKFGKSMQSNDGGVTAAYGLNSSHSYSIPHILHDDEAPDEVVSRLMDGLQKLQPESTMETAASRLITAHSALATHMLNESKSLRELSVGLHLSNPPPEETADLLTDLLKLAPAPQMEPFYELSSLNLLTAQLVSQLSLISDSLHMARQSSTAANRKLRIAREACAEWKGELEAAERGRKYIDEGDWVGKCSRREAAGVCVEVMEGFEKFCLGMEKDMQAMLTV